jgi:hypothetical protein
MCAPRVRSVTGVGGIFRSSGPALAGGSIAPATCRFRNSRAGYRPDDGKIQCDPQDPDEFEPLRRAMRGKPGCRRGELLASYQAIKLTSEQARLCAAHLVWVRVRSDCSGRGLAFFIRTGNCTSIRTSGVATCTKRLEIGVRKIIGAESLPLRHLREPSRRPELHRNFNDIRVRCFIRNGAPFRIKLRTFI